MNTSDKPGLRILQLRKDLKLSQKSFAEKVNITQGALSQLESGKSTLSLPTIQKISQAFTIDCNWLVLGSKEPDASAQKDKNMVKGIINKKTKNREIPVESFIPLIDEEAHAGYLKQANDPDYISALDVYRIPGFETGNYRMFEIEGDSMLPTIHPREIVVSERVADFESIENGTLCIAITADGIVAKRFYCYKEEPDTFLFKSDNADYKTYSLSSNKVAEIWQIKAKITSVLQSESPSNSQRFKSIETDILQLKNAMQQLARPTSHN